jgi:cell division protein FtsW (lipid II flippase)
VGYGKGVQTQTNALTGKHTDFIFSVAGEELV